MATLKSIRKRISSTRSTEKLTHAMKMIATSRMRRAHAGVLEARHFNTENARILSELIRRTEDIDNPLLKEHEKKAGVIDLFIITSDRGLCGSFNEGLLRYVLTFIKDEEEKGNEVLLYVIGKKGRDFLRRHNLTIERAFDAAQIEEEIKEAIARYLNNVSDETMVAFNRFKKVGSSEIAVQRILPASPPEAKFEYCVDYIYEPGLKEVTEAAIENMIRSNIILAFLESTAAELSARMIAMDKASKNAKDLIVSLTMMYNKARQAAITGELIDIVGGSEALK